MPRKRPTKKRGLPLSSTTPETPTITEEIEPTPPTSQPQPDQMATEPEIATDEPDLGIAAAGPSASRGSTHTGDLLADLPPAEPDGDKRFAKREARKVRTVVHVRESTETSWKEIVEVQTVSRNGAALELSRPCPVGRILTLVMDMPRELRAYDHFAQVYPVAGVVQNCTEILVDDKLVYHVGVAFIGKQLPRSHKNDPSRTYRISGVDSSGLWQVTEAPNDYSARRDARFWHSIPVTVSYRNDHQKTVERSEVTTRDISRGGMAVWGPLEVEVGERIKLSSKDHSFFTMAKVCNRSDHARDRSKSLIHLQFEGNRFPVHMLAQPDGDGAPWPPPEEADESTRT